MPLAVGLDAFAAGAQEVVGLYRVVRVIFFGDVAAVPKEPVGILSPPSVLRKLVSLGLRSFPGGRSMARL